MIHSHHAALRAHPPGGRLLTVCLILILVAVFLPPVPAGANPPAGSDEFQGVSTGQPLGALLRADGTLDLNSGFRGSLDASGWRLAAKPGQAPRFIPDAAPTAPGDEFWAAGYHTGGVDYTVHALALDGAGNLYVGGGFTTAGGVVANRIAKWDGTAWSPLGSGMWGEYRCFVHALALDAAGDLYAGGEFTTAGGVSASNIAKWDGMAWSPLGSGIGEWYNEVRALALDDAGNLYAGGLFGMAGGVGTGNIAKWDGTAWSPLGSGMAGDAFVHVYALALDSVGTLYAGGDFTRAGGVVANRIAKWDGTAWSPLGSGMEGESFVRVYALALDDAGTLYAGGWFTTAGGVRANGIAKWNGTAWSPLGSGMYIVSALALDSAGNLYAGGPSNIAKWDGTAWSPLDSGMNGDVLAVALDGSGATVFVGGTFWEAGGVSASYIAKWDGTAWSPLGRDGNGMIGSVSALALDDAGTLYAGGEFWEAGGVSVNNIAKWDGTAWSPLGSGMEGEYYHHVYALALDSAGTLYAGGDFTEAGGVVVNRIAKWNGTAWSPLGSGMEGGYLVTVYALALDYDGTLYAGGWFTTAGGVSVNNIAKWDGTAWSPLGSGTNGEVFALALDDAGTLFAGGSFWEAGGGSGNRIAKWDGAAWSALGSGVDRPVHALALDGVGNLYAGGDFTTAGGVLANNIAKWDGAAWLPLGSGMGPVVRYAPTQVDTLALNDAGELYAGGWFTTAGGVVANRIAKWDGTVWWALGSGMGGGGYPISRALAVDHAGILYAGGGFSTAGGKPSRAIAQWARPNVVAPIEHPGAGAFVTGTVTLTGFAIDRTSANGTGIDRVHIYLDGPYGTGTIIGGATYGLPRPDVAAQHGDRFGPSGWELVWNTAGLTQDVHRLYLYAHRTTDNTWSLMPPHLVVVGADHGFWLPLVTRG